MGEVTNKINELCWEIEKLPASEQQTKISVMASSLSKDYVHRDKVAGLVEALQYLYDEQNGPPLIRHKESWENAMKQATQALANIERDD